MEHQIAQIAQLEALRTALDQWVAGWMAQREYAWELRATERALFHRLHTECCRAFDAWVQVVQWWLFGHQIGHHGRLRVLREALRSLVAAAVNRRQLLVALGHYRYGEFHRGWRTWRAHAQAARAALGARLAHAVRLLLNRQLARGWHAWVAYAETHVAARAKSYRALASLLHQALSRALRGWITHVEQAAAANAKRLRAIASLFNQKLARALRGWIARVEQAAAAKAILQTAFATFLHQALARALRAWCAETAQWRFLRTIVHRWRERALSTTFVHWSTSSVLQGE